MRRRLMLAQGVATGLLAGRGRVAAAAGRELEFTSPYNFVFIQKEGALVTFRYSIGGGRMSAIDLANPAFQVVPYTGYYYAAELIRPGPRNVLMAGLGAGGFNRLFNLAHPEARLVTVEIDPMIQRLAEEHAAFRTGPGNEVVIEDARVYLRRSRETFDWIVLDAFDKESQIPVHLTTREFYRILADRLAGDGVVVANLHQGTRFFASHVLTIRDVFADVTLLPVASRGNVIVAAVKGGAPIRERLAGPGAGVDRALLERQGVDLARIAASALHAADYLPRLGEGAIVLTDDYAPVESLDQEPLPPIEGR